MTTERLIASLEKNLGSDDARATKRLAIAEAYLREGDKRSAVEWFLKAAAHAEFSERLGAPLVYARRALELVPDDAGARSEVKRLEEKYEVRISEGDSHGD
ncbi:MAG: hypothetical protein ACYDCL_01870 [Myxococcales bacterium]